MFLQNSVNLVTKMLHLKKIVQTSHLLCKRLRCYHGASKEQIWVRSLSFMIIRWPISWFVCRRHYFTDFHFTDTDYIHQVFLPPATKLWQGNVFTPVCHSVHGEGGSLSRGSLSRGSRSRGSLSGRPPRVRLRAGGTHPTEMHSCLWLILLQFSFKFPSLPAE